MRPEAAPYDPEKLTGHPRKACTGQSGFVPPCINTVAASMTMRQAREVNGFPKIDFDGTFRREIGSALEDDLRTLTASGGGLPDL
jgi:hypothetical protein